MRRLGLALVALVVIVVAGVLVAPALVPQDTLKRLVSERASAALGRELRLGGDLSLSVLPRLTVGARDVALGGGAGGPGPELLELGELQVDLAPWPLLSGRVEIARFVLVRPVVTLAIDKRGRGNWESAPGGSTAPAGPTDNGGQPTGSLPALSLADLRIEDGRVTFVDQRSGQRLVAERINATAALPGLDQPARVQGDLVVEGAKVGFSVQTGAPATLLAGKRAPVELALSAGANRLRLQGEAGTDGLTGDLDLELGALRELLALAKVTPPAAPLPDHGAVRAKLDAGPSRATLRGLDARLGTIEAQGELVAEYGGARPALTGSLETKALDLGPFMTTATAPTKPAPGGERSDAPAAAAPRAWSAEPLGLPRGLPVDIELALRSGPVTAPPVALDRVQALFRARADRVRVNLEEVGLYGGTAQGVVSVVDEGGTPKLRVNLTGENLQAQPLLAAFAGFDRLAGTMRLAANVAATGDSERRIVETLSGQGELRFTDGAYVGVNVADLIRRFTEPGSAASGPQQTDFSALGGTFQVRGGILRNDDLELQAPLLRLQGRGQVDLPRQRFDKYRIEPKAVATLKGQGGKRDARGILIPFVIDGPWSAPKIRPDLAGAAGQLIEQPELLEQLVPGASKILPKGVAPDAATDLLKGLLPKSSP
jgi:AsmA protein